MPEDGSVAELVRTRQMLDNRYDDLKSGRVKPIDGETFFEGLRKREDELLRQSATGLQSRGGLRTAIR